MGGGISSIFGCTRKTVVVYPTQLAHTQAFTQESYWQQNAAEAPTLEPWTIVPGGGYDATDDDVGAAMAAVRRTDEIALISRVGREARVLVVAETT